MKYTFLILLVFAITLSSCDKAGNKTTNRITLKESTLPGDFRYEIIEVDGVEYLCSSSRGGIYPLVKDTTAKKIVFKINN
jgi:hypothetical protein